MNKKYNRKTVRRKSYKTGLHTTTATTNVVGKIAFKRRMLRGNMECVVVHFER